MINRKRFCKSAPDDDVMTMAVCVTALLVTSYSQYRLASRLDHGWVSGAWLTSLGLSQYSAAFETQLVDARLLNVLSRKDLDKHLSVRNKFHQSSILHAVELLRIVRFDVQVAGRLLPGGTKQQRRRTELN